VLRTATLRTAIFVLLLASLPAYSQTSAAAPESQSPAQSAATQPLAPEVAEAEAAIATSDWKSAEAKLTPYIAAHSADSRALFDAGYVADAQNRLDDAVALYRRAIEADPKSFEAHVSLGLLLARQGKFEDARPELALATNLDAGAVGPLAKARAWRALAQIDRPGPGHDGDTTEASNDLLEALKLSPETPDDTLLAAALADQAGEFDAAQKAYRRVLAADPKSVAANAGLAHLLIAAKQFPEAETLLRAALLQAPDDPALTAQLATVLAAQDKAEALPLIQKLHDAHPENAAITRMLAEILSESGDSAGSDRYYITLLAASPKDPDLLVAHAQNLTRLLHFPEAFAVFDKATQIDPANAEGWAGLAFTASKTNQPSITLHALTMRSKYLPEVPSTYFLWATSYDSLHQKVEAVTYYRHFLEASAGKFPNQEWQARQRIQLLTK
jgi:tetratricopeptide (TPR) repeat protein